MKRLRRACIALLALCVTLVPPAWADEKSDQIERLQAIFAPPEDLLWAENLLMLAQFKSALLVSIDAELKKRNLGADWLPTHAAWKTARAESIGQFDGLMNMLLEGSVVRDMRRETLVDLPAEDRSQLIAVFDTDLGRKLIGAATIASVAGSFQNYVISRATDRRGEAPETIALADLQKVEAILRKHGASFGKLTADEESRIKELASGPAAASFRQLNMRMGGKVLQLIGKEIANGAKFEAAGAIADRAVKRYQDAR